MCIRDSIPPLPEAIAAFKSALNRCREAEDHQAKVMAEGGWLSLAIRPEPVERRDKVANAIRPEPVERRDKVANAVRPELVEGRNKVAP